MDLEQARVKFDEIVYKIPYFAVCCGRIEEFEILEIFQYNGSVESLQNYFQARCIYKNSNYVVNVFLSDLGIGNSPNDYNNNLNYVFRSLDEAYTCISSYDYQYKLLEHKNWISKNFFWENF